MKFRNRFTLERPSFQLAPMIDVVFILLSFFIATQMYAKWETEIDIKLPTAETGDLPSRLPGEVIINIMQDGNTVIHGKTLDDHQLTLLLARLVELFPGQPILIRADELTPYGDVIGVLDLCRKSDIWNISFATATSKD